MVGRFTGPLGTTRLDGSPVLQALRHTPTWVYFVFFALLLVGYGQSRDRTVRRARVIALPIAMLCLSAYGVASSFGFALLPFAYWAGGFLVVVAFVRLIRTPAGVTYSANSETFRVPGSWLPLALMMAIFSIKYATGYALARPLSFAHHAWFVSSVSAGLGALSGVFVARAASIWRSATK